MIDYNSEVKRLSEFVPGENSQFWKPLAGQYRVRALTELEESKPYIDKTTKKETPQVKIDLLIGEDTFTWTIPKGVSPASAYGQLCNLATAYNNSLKNIDFMIVVTNDKKKNTYTIVKL